MEENKDDSPSAPDGHNDKPSSAAQDQSHKEEAKADSKQSEKLIQETRQDEPKQAGKPVKKTEEVKQAASKLKVNTTNESYHDESKVQERDDFDHEESNKNWHEYRIVGKAPRRRGYHACFIHGDYFYIHGGHDIREGSLEKMHKIHLDPKAVDNSWEAINPRGVEKPGKIAFHTLTRHENKAYLIGGSNLEKDNENMYEFNIETAEWRVIRPLGALVPEPRDEHSAHLWKDSIVVFGGNVNGFKTNIVLLYHIIENKWEKLATTGDIPERSNHAATLIGDSLYVFGGKDVDNNKLNDFWKLDLNSKAWTKLEQGGEAPLERSGCSLVGYKNYLILFGGIFELTKELGDCYAYDITTKTWYTLFEEIDSPTHKHSPNSSFGLGKFGRQDSIKNPSPANKASNSFQASHKNEFSMSLKKTKTKAQQKKVNIFEVDSSMIKKQRMQKALKKKKDQDKNPLEDSMLTSPTSLSMKNSFLIKNSGKGFDNYYSSIKRRKMGQSMSPDITGFSPAKGKRVSKISGVRPRPRDGHTAAIYNNMMIIFGGDRHQMPFNDLFSLNLEGEINK